VLIATSSFEQHGYKDLVVSPLAGSTMPASRPGRFDLGIAPYCVKTLASTPQHKF